MTFTNIEQVMNDLYSKDFARIFLEVNRIKNFGTENNLFIRFYNQLKEGEINESDFWDSVNNWCWNIKNTLDNIGWTLTDILTKKEFIDREIKKEFVERSETNNLTMKDYNNLFGGLSENEIIKEWFMLENYLYCGFELYFINDNEILVICNE